MLGHSHYLSLPPEYGSPNTTIRLQLSLHSGSEHLMAEDKISNIYGNRLLTIDKSPKQVHDGKHS